VNNWLISLTDEELKNVVNTILDYFDDHIRDKLAWLGSYVMDLVILGMLIENVSIYSSLSQFLIVRKWHTLFH
jgi:hypothetical protein